MMERHRLSRRNHWIEPRQTGFIINRALSFRAVSVCPHTEALTNTSLAVTHLSVAEMRGNCQLAPTLTLSPFLDFASSVLNKLSLFYDAVGRHCSCFCVWKSESVFWRCWRMDYRQMLQLESMFCVCVCNNQNVFFSFV